MVLTGKSNVTNLMEIPGSKAHAEGSLTKLSDLDPDLAEACLGNYTSFLMVRHPFERLLSAFRNKLEDTLPSARYFQARIGRYIIKKYRPDATQHEIETGDSVTFREFVRYLIEEGIEQEDTNEHWRPVHQLCQPCSVNYSFVGKHDRFEEDAETVLDMIGAPKLDFPRSKSGGTAYYLKHYLRQLSLDDIEKLYRLYEVDFKMFGYNLEDILGFDIG